MNTERLLAVADAIENHTIPDLGFNMADYVMPADEDFPDMSGQQCGTVACIAGWAAKLSDEAEHDKPFSDGRDYLRLTEVQACKLFLPSVDYPYSAITPAQAVAVLRHAAATGTIDWARVLDTPTEAEA